MSAHVLHSLGASSAMANIFWSHCEFAVCEEDKPRWFALESGEQLQVVGRDACGGQFCLYPESEEYDGRLLYVDSEGRAGIIAASLSEGVQMMIALPYWRDCLKFSGDGKIEEMQKARRRLEAGLRQSDIEKTRRTLYQALSLDAPIMPLESLHRTLAESANVRVLAVSDGSPFQSLFNKFIVEDCPTWKQQS